MASSGTTWHGLLMRCAVLSRVSKTRTWTSALSRTQARLHRSWCDWSRIPSARSPNLVLRAPALAMVAVERSAAQKHRLLVSHGQPFCRAASGPCQMLAAVDPKFPMCFVQETHAEPSGPQGTADREQDCGPGHGTILQGGAQASWS